MTEIAEKPIDNAVLARMVRHCEDHSCDGCPGVDRHCLGRQWMTVRVGRALEAQAAAERDAYNLGYNNGYIAARRRPA